MSRICSALLPVLFLSLVGFCGSGCVGPNKLKRGLDQHLNESYVKRPALSQLLFPVNLVANHLAVLGDLLFINPTYWWKDVFRGEGTPYHYTNPEMPGETPASEEEDQELPPGRE